MADDTCSVPNCDRNVTSRGYCNKHYRHLKNWGHPTEEVAALNPCTAAGCQRPTQAKGLCPQHYRLTYYPNTADNPYYRKTCTECGTEYTTTRSDGTYCSSTCYGKVLSRRAAARRAATPPPIQWHGTYIHTCQDCGTQFNVTQPTAKRCTTCKKRHAWRAKWKRNHPDARTAEQIAAEARTCPECGRTFHSPVASKTYCSSHCVHQAARARGATGWNGSWISPNRRASIYQRDSFTCYLCGCELDTNKEHRNEPNAATLDHVIPRAKGGSNDSANLRACCRACNSAKSDHDLETFKLKLAV